MENTQDSSYADSQDSQTLDIDTKTEDFAQNTTSSNEVTTKKQFENSNSIESNTDQELYDEILEKLDIKPRKEQQDIQEQSTREKRQEAYLKKLKDAEKSQAKTKVEKSLSQDFGQIQKLVKAGLINSTQGQNLKKQVLKKAFDKIVQTEKTKRSLNPAKKNVNRLNKSSNRNNAFEEFSQNNPNFFTSDGRNEVLNYLKSNNVNLGKDELNSISNVVRTVEKAAIDRYLQKVAHEKTLRNSNNSAKQRLTANAQKSSIGGNFSRTFTREQIGKMSSAEFAKYESAIMNQLKKGLIR